MNIVAFTPDFVDTAKEWLKDKEFAEQIGIYDGDMTDDIASGVVQSWADNPRSSMFWIMNEGKPVGFAMLAEINPRFGSCVIHFAVHDKSLHGGYGVYRCVRDVLVYAFKYRDMHRVQAVEVGDRHDIMRMLDRGAFGFKKEGVLREAILKNGKRYDAIIYSVLEHEFNFGR